MVHQLPLILLTTTALLAISLAQQGDSGHPSTPFIEPMCLVPIGVEITAIAAFTVACCVATLGFGCGACVAGGGAIITTYGILNAPVCCPTRCSKLPVWPGACCSDHESCLNRENGLCCFEGLTACNGKHCCKPGVDQCLPDGRCCPKAQVCGDSCDCPSSKGKCLNQGIFAVCCPWHQVCGNTCCGRSVDGLVCVDEGRGLCCKTGDVACGSVCCPPGDCQNNRCMSKCSMGVCVDDNDCLGARGACRNSCCYIKPA